MFIMKIFYLFIATFYLYTAMILDMILNKQFFSF